MVVEFGNGLDIFFGIFLPFREWDAGRRRGGTGVVWKRDRVQIVRRVLVHDRDPMMTSLARNPEATGLPVNQWIESHKKWYTKYRFMVLGSDPEI